MIDTDLGDFRVDQQSLDTDSGLVQYLPESARADLPVIRHDDAGAGASAPEDYVAPSLAVDDKSY
jgi:hypothetical protein